MPTADNLSSFWRIACWWDNIQDPTFFYSLIATKWIISLIFELLNGNDAIFNQSNIKFDPLRFTQCRIQMYFGNVWTVWAPKKVLVTLFPYIFHVKPKWNIAYEYLKTKVFSRDLNILPQMHWISNIFGLSATTTGRFLGITKLSNP